MVPKAQAGVEYLLSYGWALILVVTVIGVLLFVVSGPDQDILFRSSDPTKILLKGAVALGDAVQIKLQNITGGKITITALTSSDYANLTLNGQSPPIEIGAGGEMIIEATGSTGTIEITYLDYSGMERIVRIRGGPEPEEPTPEGTEITECGTNITESGTYYLSGPLSTASGDCITVNADNVTLNCYDNTITKTGGQADYGVYLESGQNITVQNCEITGFYFGINTEWDTTSNCTISGNTLTGSETGIQVLGSDGTDITGNTATGNQSGIFITDSYGMSVTGNTASGNSTGIYVYVADAASNVQGNTASGNYTGIYIAGVYGSMPVQGNNANSNNAAGIYISECDEVVVEGNTVQGNHNAVFGAVGIELRRTNDAFLNSNTGITGNDTGILIDGGEGNTIQGNVLSNNVTNLYMEGSYSNTLNNNTVCDGTSSGFQCFNSDGTSGTGNFFDDLDPPCEDPAYGIWPVLGVHYTECP